MNSEQITMNNKSSISIIAFLLTALFVYAAVSKLLDVETFRQQMLNQPLPEMLTMNLAWALPLVELLVAGALVTKRFQTLGFFAAFGLMAIFTLYVGLMVMDVFDRVPCSCGGVLSSLSWGEHLVFNVVFLGMAIAGVILISRQSAGAVGK